MDNDDSQFDINKMSAEFLDKNLERFAQIGYSIFKGTKNSIKIKLRRSYESYLNNITNKYAKTKSFFFRDEAVYLKDFYIPLSLSVKNSTIGKASSRLLFSKNDYIFITGTAGCGKSILMKYLMTDILKTTELIPIFLELRDSNKSNLGLVELIKQTLLNNKLNLDYEYFERAFEEGYFVFFFDGFDEIDLNKRLKISQQIMEINQKYDKCKIIISSRPDYDFSGWKDFTVFNVNNLDLEEACELIEKLPYDEDTKQKFIDDLKKELFKKHNSFLSNPLLLSIMLLTYGQSLDIPNKLNIFYNQAYEALFQRHDTLKGGFQRYKLIKLDIQDYAKVFSAFSIQTYDKREFQFTRIEALEYLNITKKIINVDFNSEHFLSDSLQSSCLLIEDGLLITFSHRSFQEYFTARFINESPIDIQKKLINKYSKNLRYDSVFTLLYEMNPTTLEKLFIVPRINELFEKINLKSKVGITHFTKYLKLCYDRIEFRNNELHAFTRTDNNFLALSGFTSFVLKNCGYLVGWDGFMNMKSSNDFYEKYIGSKEIAEYKLKSLNNKSELIKDLYNHGRFFSKTTLDLLIKIRNAIILKHKNSELSIEEILFNK